MSDNTNKFSELQMARGLTYVRWAAIPGVLVFSLICSKALNMSFAIEPIYVIACVLAILNIYFTLHIALLSRQMQLNYGISSLKRVLLRVLGSTFSRVKAHGLFGIFQIPITIIRVCVVFYLMLLESLKDLPLNPFNLRNVVHTQVITDIAAILFLTRFTGTTESPLMLLSVVPIIVSGAVAGFHTGAFYAFTAAFGYAALCCAIKYGFMPHIKFYSPAFGDLSQNSGWIIAVSMVILAGYLVSAYIASKLTGTLRERILHLSGSITRMKSTFSASLAAAEYACGSWLVCSSTGQIECVNTDKGGFFSSAFIGENLFELFPELQHYGIAYVMQSVVTSCSAKSLDKVKLKAKKGNSIHIFDLKIKGFKDSDGKIKVLAAFDEKTEMLTMKERLENIKREKTELKGNYDEISLENKENKRIIEELQQQTGDKSEKIESLSQKISGLDRLNKYNENELANVYNELAAVKAKNDELSLECSHKENLLDEICELIESCSSLDELSAVIEEHAKELFKLDNTCIHIFHSEENKNRKSEIFDIRKASPKLLEAPRNNVSVLNTVIEEGRPVIINANIRQEESASVEINDNQLKRLIAYIPIRYRDEVLGMMMFEKYDYDDNSEMTVKLISYYLKYSAVSIKNALAFKEINHKNENLHKNITKITTRLDSIRAMVFSGDADAKSSYSSFLSECVKITPVKDAMLVKLDNDSGLNVLCRVDKTRPCALNDAETAACRAIIANPKHKATLEPGVACEYACHCYPMHYNLRLFGMLILYLPPEENEAEQPIIDFCVRLMRDKFSLNTLNEEKELWESFYSTNVSA